MAATFTVEDGTGLSSANAFCSVAFVDQYNDDTEQLAAWSDALQAVKEQHIRLATRAIAVQYAGSWRGTRKKPTQALPVPMVNAVDDDGFAIDDESVPVALAEATSVLALRSVAGEDIVPDQERSTIVRERSKLKSLEEEVEYSGGKVEGTDFVLVRLLMSQLVYSSGRVVRG